MLGFWGFFCGKSALSLSPTLSPYPCIHVDPSPPAAQHDPQPPAHELLAPLPTSELSPGQQSPSDPSASQGESSAGIPLNPKGQHGELLPCSHSEVALKGQELTSVPHRRQDRFL